MIAYPKKHLYSLLKLVLILKILVKVFEILLFSCLVSLLLLANPRLYLISQKSLIIFYFLKFFFLEVVVIIQPILMILYFF